MTRNGSDIPTDAGPARLASLDQFRGFTVLGMYVVNFMAHFQVTPDALKHHPTYVTYADMVMPQFVLAAGFASRLTFRRRVQSSGMRAAYGHLIRRSVVLLLLGLLMYGVDGSLRTWAELRSRGIDVIVSTAFQRNYFQTLVHIGLTTLWVLPVIAAGPRARVGYCLSSGALHVAFSALGYYDFAMARPVIDGGALGFLTWTVPFLVGTLAYDVMSNQGANRQVAVLGTLSIALMTAGYGLSCLRGFVVISDGTVASTLSCRLAAPPLIPPSDSPDLWTMSQRAGSLSYLTFAAGFALVTYAMFVVFCDRGRFRWSVFQVLGQNALVAYMIHIPIERVAKPYLPKDSPEWFAWLAFLAFAWICVAFVRWLEKSGVRVRL